MNFKKVIKRFEKKDCARVAHLRNEFICLPVILLSFLLFSGFVSAANYCATPGRDGTGPPSGVINTYHPGTASVSAGATSIPVGSSSGSATPIAAGDLLLIIQMQDADINYNNNNNYGSGTGTGRGYTNLNQAGLYEYAVAAGAVSGGFVSITQGLANNYRYRAASATYGQSTYQVIRVPQYSSATVSSSVSALNWNGSVGGIVVMDVAGTLTINNTITANGTGFRGGFGRSLGGGAGAWTDYLTSYLVNDNASKAEGIAGTPYYMNRPATFDGAPAQVTGGSGYPDGTTTNASYARGAPGNAGGGGTDGNPTGNDQNTGGGGGGNYAIGGLGGNSWSTNRVAGGVGGSAVASIAYNRVVMGGGGGAGTTNNATADNATYTNPAGLACTAGAGACSSGAPGGGIVILRANNIAGASTISANGGNAYNVLNDGAGGGGAAGAVVLYSATGGSATAYANGGNGGNAWRSQVSGTYPGERHGPGGGGSGGFIAYSPSIGMSTQYNAGVCGMTTTANDTYGASSSSSGSSTSYSSNPPGALPSSSCLPNLSTSTKTWLDINGSDQNPGDVIRYTITLIETANNPAGNVTVTDNIPANVNSFTVVSFPAGATDSSTPTGGTNGTGYLNITGVSAPANGSATIVFDVTINNPLAAGTLINNTATITPPLGTGATPAAPTITVSDGTVPATGNKPLYLYGGAASPYKMSRYPTPGTPTTATINNGGSAIWNGNWNGLAGTTVPLQLNDTISSASASLLINENNTSPNNTRNVQLRLYCSSNAAAYASWSGNLAPNPPTSPAAPTLYNFNLTTLNGGFTFPATCNTPNYWVLRVYNNTGTAGRTITVVPVSGTTISQVILASQNVINVDSIGFYNAAYSAGTAITTTAPGQTVYIRATVSDPFGSYDITGATLTLTNPLGTPLTPVTMTQVYDSNAATKIYEYQYTFPSASSSVGNWTARVVASEGSEGNVTDYGLTSFPVALATLSILKSANKAAVVPGEVITYSILVTNTSAVTATNSIVTDLVPTYTTYVANSTRLNGITVAGDGATSPLIAGLLIDNNNSRTPGAAATGAMPAGATATITFQVTVY